MKRRTLLGGLAAGAIVGASGLIQHKWGLRHVVKKYSLSQFTPSGSFDVCIIGTGPAGCTLAERLSDAGQRVLLLESGAALTNSTGMQKAFTLDTYSSSGVLDYPLQSSRMRTLGGTSSIWTGRCPRMLPSDFSDNHMAPEGGWPVTYTELQPYYRAAEKTLHVTGGKLTAFHAPRDRDLPGKPRNISRIRALVNPLNISIDPPPVSRKRRFFEDDGPIRFASDLLPALSHRPNVQVLCEATATRILNDSRGRISGIRVQSLGGVEEIIMANHYVIACGCVESTRLLLLSGNEHFPDGIGNHADHLGRYFMEHPFISYTAEIPDMEPFDRWELGRTYQLVETLKHRGLGGVVLAFYANPKKPQQLTIKMGIEMTPFSDNRIRLNSGMIDPFGNPGADLQLDFSDMDRQLLTAGEEIVYNIFNQLHSAEIRKHEELHWSHHHMGTTRMSKSPGDGVVDPNLRAHGTENLYILSSSVFVTSGVANPTLTITALAHRLSEHLNKAL